LAQAHRRSDRGAARQAAARPHRVHAGYQLRRRPGRRAPAAARLIQSSHALYHSFGGLNWRAPGISDGMIGVL